jgi:hypothetical protein
MRLLERCGVPQTSLSRLHEVTLGEASSAWGSPAKGQVMPLAAATQKAPAPLGLLCAHAPPPSGIALCRSASAMPSATHRQAQHVVDCFGTRARSSTDRASDYGSFPD